MFLNQYTIRPTDKAAMERTKHRLDTIAKPLHSLGELENVLVRLAGMGELRRSYKCACIVMCADNGVVAEGVTQTGSEITAKVAENMKNGTSSVCCMAREAEVKVLPVDIGMNTEVEGLLNVKTRKGTENLACTAAMTREEAVAAIKAGMQVAFSMVEQGYSMLATGEMGIGNTTTATAVACALLGLSPALVTGKGAGLSKEGLARKVSAIERGLQVNQISQDHSLDAIDILSRVGGLDIAGMTGVFLGGAVMGVPVIMDGLISSVAALVAKQIAPECVGYLLASHLSAEPAAPFIMENLGLKPLLSIGMALGEGTGAVSVVPLIRMALAVYYGLPSFEEIHMEAYQPL